MSLFFLIFALFAIVQSAETRAKRCHFFINNSGDFPQKKTASCPGRDHTEVPRCTAVGIVNNLNLDRNKIQTLHEVSFITWKHVVELSLRENKIVTITDKAFKPLKKLQRLVLSGNSIGLPDCMHAAVFQFTPQLRLLDLSYNPLFKIPERFFAQLSLLEELYLSNAKENMKLLPYSFAGLHRLRVLDLSNNALRRLPATGMKECLANMTLDTLLLGGDNRWVCDCHMRWLKMWHVQRKEHSPLKIQGFTYNAQNKKVPQEPVCAGPDLVKDRHLFGDMIQITHFQCKPVVRSRPARYLRPVHSNLTLSCTIYSDPKGVVTWSKDGTLVQPHWTRARATQSQGVEFRAELLIVDLRPADAGEWVCMAKNRRGHAQVNFTVEVVLPGGPGHTLTRVVIYCGIGAAGAVLLCLGIGLAAYCLNCCRRRKDYRGYNKGTAGGAESAGSSGGLIAETRRLHTPTDAANPATDESDYETAPPGDMPLPSPPVAALASPALAQGVLGGSQAGTLHKGGTLRLEKVAMTSNLNQEAAFATLQRPPPALKAPNCIASTGAAAGAVPLTSSANQAPTQQCPVHGATSNNAAGHYSPCPVHGDATLARNALAAGGSASGPTSNAGGGHNNPLYGTMPATSTTGSGTGGRYKPCPLHGDVYATLQTRQAVPPRVDSLQSPSPAGSTTSAATVALQTIMRARDSTDSGHATYIRASRVDDCIAPGGGGGSAANGASNGDANPPTGEPLAPKSVSAGVKGPADDEGYSTSV